MNDSIQIRRKGPKVTHVRIKSVTEDAARRAFEAIKKDKELAKFEFVMSRFEQSEPGWWTSRRMG